MLGGEPTTSERSSAKSGIAYIVSHRGSMPDWARLFQPCTRLCQLAPLSRGPRCCSPCAHGCAAPLSAPAPWLFVGLHPRSVSARSIWRRVHGSRNAVPSCSCPMEWPNGSVPAGPLHLTPFFRKRNGDVPFLFHFSSVCRADNAISSAQPIRTSVLRIS